MIPFLLPINIFLRNKLKHSVQIKLFLYRIVWLIPKPIKKTTLIWEELNTLSKKKKNIFFVNIGANDGIAGDPLTEFIFRKHWRGIMVEPVDYIFKRLQRLYGTNKNIFLEQVALAEHSTQKKFYYLEKNNELAPGYDQIGSFDSAHIHRHATMFPGYEKYIRSINVPCVSLKDLLKKYKNPQVDVYVVDTEGFDFEVIRQINFSGYKPTLIIYEYTHMPQKTLAACTALLKQNGYIVINDDGNAVARLKKV